MKESSESESVYEDANSKIDYVESGVECIMYDEEAFYETKEICTLPNNAMIFDLDPKEEKQLEGHQVKPLRSHQVLAKTSNDMDPDFNVVNVSDVNNYNDFKKQLKQHNIELIFHIDEYDEKYHSLNEETVGNETIYLKFNNVYLKLNKTKLKQYHIKEDDGKIIIEHSGTKLTFTINKNEIAVYDSSVSENGRFKYVYNIKDNKLFLQKDNLDDLELYQYGSLGLKDSDRFYQQTQGYRGNFMRTWNQKQTPKNLLLACMGISNESKDGERTNNCLLNSCCSDDHDIDIINTIKNDIQHEKRYSDYYNYTKSKGRAYQYNTLSLSNANQKVYPTK